MVRVALYARYSSDNQRAASIKDQFRICRDQADVATLFKHLKFAGVKIVTLAEGEISELHVGLKGTMNAHFLKDLAQKTHRVRGDREIAPNEANIIRRIFKDFAARVRSRTRSMMKVSLACGSTPRFGDMSSAAQGSSTTNSISAASSGTGSAISRIPQQVSGGRG